jgi:hypothetical protein
MSIETALWFAAVSHLRYAASRYSRGSSSKDRVQVGMTPRHQAGTD